MLKASIMALAAGAALIAVPTAAAAQGYHGHHYRGHGHLSVGYYGGHGYHRYARYPASDGYYPSGYRAYGGYPVYRRGYSVSIIAGGHGHGGYGRHDYGYGGHDNGYGYRGHGYAGGHDEGHGYGGDYGHGGYDGDYGDHHD